MSVSLQTPHPQSVQESDSRPARRTRWLVLLVAALLLAALLALLWGLNMRRGVNHDEHQFIASAAYMARTDDLPYVDFIYFHVPVLSLIYAALFRLSDSLLLTARLFSVLCAWLTLALLMWTGYRSLPGQSPWIRLLNGAAAAGLLAFTPLFIYTSGRAWNHDLPVLLTLAALLTLEYGLLRTRGARQDLAVGLAGLLIALAMGTRLSFALAALALLIAIWLQPRAPTRNRAMDTLWFGIGGLIGALPVLFFFAIDPAAFLFGNLGYVGLNTAYYQAELPGYPGMTLARKFNVWLDLLFRQPANLPPWIALLIGLPMAWSTLQRNDQPDARWRLTTALLMLVAAFVSALAATPAQTQYFYAVQPWLVMGAIYAYAAWPPSRQRTGVWLLAAAAALAMLLTARAYAPGLAIVAQPDEWVPRKIHARGELLATLVDEGGKVLTLSPIHPLEGGVPVYREFVTGPFAWRVASLMDAETRRELDIAGPDDLPALLADDPPRALLTGLDNDDLAEEAPLVAYAEANGFLPIPLPDEGLLWLSPLAAWDGTIHLGAHTLPPTSLMPGDDFVSTFYLQAMQSIDRDLNVLVRVVDEGGNELLRDEGWPLGRPTSAWITGEVWADGHALTIPADAEPGYYRVELNFYDPADLEILGEATTVGYLRVGEPPDSEQTLAVLRDDQGEALALHNAGRSASDGGVTVDLTWQALRPLDRDYTGFVHVVDGAGNLVAQHDSPPLNGFFPTSFWRPGWPVEESISFPLASGDYTVYAGFYAPETGERLTVYAHEQAVGDAVMVGRVE